MEIEGSRRAELARILGVEPTGEAFEEGRRALEAAAIEEFLSMVVGDYNPQRMEDVREFRLMVLIKNYFGGRLPSAERVAKIFHLTTSQGRTLIKRTLATYETQLKEVAAITASHIVSVAREVDDDSDVERWEFQAEPAAAAYLNELLATRNPLLPPIKRRPNTVGQFVMEKPTFESLRELVEAK